MLWYYNCVVRRPYLMVLAIAVVSLSCIIVSFTINTLPDFTNPTLGFEARGTNIGQRLMAWQNLIDETGPSGTLVANPNYLPLQFLDMSDDAKPRRPHRRNRNRKKHKKPKSRKIDKEDIELTRKILASFHNREHEEDVDEGSQNTSNRSPLQWNGDNGVFRDYEITNDSWSSMEQANRSEHFEYGRNMTFIDEDFHREKVQKKKSTWLILKQAALPPSQDEEGPIPIEGYFCDSPNKEYSHFVVERIGPNCTETLFDLNGLLAMCQLQNQIAAVTNYEEYCDREMLSNNCCRPVSLPNYAALLANKSSCFDLTNDDVLQLQNLLVECFEYFHDLKLSNDCNEYKRCYAPPACTRHNVVFNILHFLTDMNFIKSNNSLVYLRYAMIFVPVKHSPKILPLFHEWINADLSNELVRAAAMDLGLENEVFNECLLTDGWLVALGGIFVMTCVWLYTASVFLTAMTCVAVIFSLGLAYFVYTIVFEMSFFPYMNLLAVVVIIGIGADNAFIFVKVWQCVLAERFTKSSTVTTQSLHSTVEAENTETLQNIMAHTFRHAALSMFVTSLTTAGAFFASYTSSITAIKCFGVFAGTVVFTNYLLMVTWLPASVSIMERLTACTACNKLQLQKLLLMVNKSIKHFCAIFEALILTAIMRYALVWVVLFGAIGLGSVFIVFYAPGLQLPENAHFQLFASDHPFEIYNSKLKNEFWFEKSMAVYENLKLPLRFVWGVQPVDDGDYTNPSSHGSLYYDNNFNVSTKAAQVWLLEFCKRLRQQPFYQLTFGQLLPNCFIENFIALMNRMCIDNMSGTDRTPCCDVSKFPYEAHIFDLCLPESISSLYATPREFFLPSDAGPKFEKPTNAATQSSNVTFTLVSPPPLVRAVVIEFESNVSVMAAYKDLQFFVTTIENWFAEELVSAPIEMQGGWFVSKLNFFDVQDTLSYGTLCALAVAMCTSLVVLLLVTLNVLISLYAVVTVTLSILTTVAMLILLDWKLNVLESVTVSSAIGLAVDFSLHYGIHYRLSPTCERIAATQFALSRIISPTIMAAVTTGFAGALMLASSVLPYIQIGLFLVIVMTVSWTYATFFLMSLLKLAGPQYGFMQFSYPKLSKRPAVNGSKYYERKQSQVVASEQLLTPSSSAVGDLINSETHELESLTSNSLIKTISGMECSALPVDFEHSFNSKPLRTIDRDKDTEREKATILLLNYQRPLGERMAVANLSATDDGANFRKT